MSKLRMFGGALGLAVAGLAAPAGAAPIGPDAAACRAGDRPSVLVRVEGFKRRTGTLRVQIYGSNPADFLAKGKKLRRIDVPVVPAGAMAVCVALPGPGDYAVAVRHDLNGNGKSGWDDGGGFSRNPPISLMHLKPSYDQVAISVGRATRPVDVRLNYRQGLSIGPLAREG